MPASASELNMPRNVTAHRHKSRPRLILTAMAVIVLAPLLASWYLTSSLSTWRPTRLSNHGLFIAPVQLSALEGLHDAFGRALDPSTLNGKWSLLVHQQYDCSRDCQTMFATLRNAQYALGKNLLRVQALAIMPASSRLQSLAEQLRTMQPPTRVLRARVKAYNDFVAQLNCSNSGEEDAAATIYVIDPAGRLMLCFPPDVPFADLVRDLKKLLAASSTG